MALSRKGSLDLVQALLDLDFDRPGRKTTMMDLGGASGTPLGSHLPIGSPVFGCLLHVAVSPFIWSLW